MGSTKPHFDRIRSLVILLERIPQEKAKGRLPNDLTFNMGDWSETLPECGTSACALGHAMMHPVFQKHGLVPYKAWSGSYLATPSYKGEDGYTHCGYDAAEEFFGIDTVTAFYWFSPSRYAPPAKPQDVADRIRAWLAEKGELGVLEQVPAV